MNKYILIGLLYLVCHSSLLCQTNEKLLTEPPKWENNFDFGCCDKVRPLDVGQEFAGRRYLIWQDKIYLYKADSGQISTQSQQWSQDEIIKLPGVMVSSGIKRTRVKWNDNNVWIKSKSKIYRQERSRTNSKNWFYFPTTTGVDFHDFEPSYGNKLFVIGTYDKRTGKPGALIEVYDKDKDKSAVLAPYPDKLPTLGRGPQFDILALTLHMAYESVKIQEYILIFNPLARRAFVFNTISNALKEINLPITPRNYEDLIINNSKQAQRITDVCWQVLPNGQTGAWIVMPKELAPQESMNYLENSDKGFNYIAFPINLYDAHSSECVIVESGRFPFYVNKFDKIEELEIALNSYSLSSQPMLTPALDKK